MYRIHFVIYLKLTHHSKSTTILKKTFKGEALNIHSDVPQIHMLPDRNYYLHYHM